MNDDKHVGRGNEPGRLLQGNEDVTINRVSKHPVPNEGDREIADGHNDVCNHNSSPHRHFGWLLRRGWNGCLDLQHYIVPSIGEGHSSQSTEEVEDCSCCGLGYIPVFNIGLHTLVDRSCPCDGGVATISIEQSKLILILFVF